MIPWRSFLSLLAALVLFGSFPLFAAPHLNQARKASAHRASHRTRESRARSHHSRYRRAYYSRHRHRAVLPVGPSSDRIEQIQGALARAGYYKADASGKWDGDTVEAMKHFQENQGLSPTGKIDALTLQKLGLGSDTAGLGAPHPPPPAPVSVSSNH
jgi:murein L,D-transpeptidase YcbB/YkuD